MKTKEKQTKKTRSFGTFLKHNWWVILLSLACAVATYLLIGCAFSTDYIAYIG